MNTKQIDDGGHVYARPLSMYEYGDGNTEYHSPQEGITYRQLLVAQGLTGIAFAPRSLDEINRTIIRAHLVADYVIAHQAKEREGK